MQYILSFISECMHLSSLKTAYQVKINIRILQAPKNWIKGRIRNGGFLRIFTVAFLLFIATAGALTLREQFPNPAGH